MANVDWIKIKNEYINTQTSYRKLADKYKVAFSTLEKTARREKWVKLRKEQCDKVATKVRQKTAEKIADKEADRLSRLASAADRLLEKIEEATEQLNNHLVTNKTKTKVIEYDNADRPDKPTKEIVEENEEVEFITGDIDKKGLKYISGALKDVKDILQPDKDGKADEEKQKESHDELIAALRERNANK